MSYFYRGLACWIMLLLCLPFSKVDGQVTFYSDNFNNGCSNGCNASGYNGWTVIDNVGGTSGGAANSWFISCAEEGVAPTGCGAGCGVPGDQSLHIGSQTPSLDGGARFNETGATNATYKLVRSPLINATGFSNIEVDFDYIAFGGGGIDRGQLWASSNGGSTWAVQTTLIAPCCGGACSGYLQGQWTHFNTTLPSGFDGSNQIVIAFHWRNNGDGVGTDPSVAIDDLSLTDPTSLPVTLEYFRAEPGDAQVQLNWKTSVETAFSHFEILRAEKESKFRTIDNIESSGGSTKGHHYNTVDDQPLLGLAFYQLKMVDLNGNAEFSKILTVDPNNPHAFHLAGVSQSDNFLELNFWVKDESEVRLELLDLNGRSLFQKGGQVLTSGTNEIMIPVKGIASGTYLIKVDQSKGASGEAPHRLVRKVRLTN